LLAAHGLAFVLLQLGFQHGGAIATAGVVTLFTNAVPIAAGMVVFHDGLPAGALGPLRVLAFAIVIGGAVLLTRPESPATATALAGVSDTERRRVDEPVVLRAKDLAADTCGEDLRRAPDRRVQSARR
jgi:hypothetical protein